MKPRTKLQKRVMELHDKLPDIEEIDNNIIEWAKEKCLEHKGFALKSKVRCMDCGNDFSPKLIKRKRAVCPHCHTKLKIEYTRKSTDNQTSYFIYSMFYDDFMVIRAFQITSIHKAGQETHYNCFEVLQHWILPNLKREVVCMNHNSSWYAYYWSGYMEIRNKRMVRKYDLYAYIYPRSKFFKSFKRIGIDHRLKGLTILEAILNIPKSPKLETLLKAKQYALLGLYLSRIERLWPSIKICIRNKYKVKDATLWADYIDLLKYFDKDVRNAHYVCPKNLKKAHDKWVEKKNAWYKKIEEEKKRKKMLQDEKRFQELKAKYLDICFQDKELTIKPLQSVKEYLEEGDRMHHCVFASGYHLKPNTLVMSARLKNKPIETVEVDLEELKVIQSRGVLNQPSEYHDRIINTINKNINTLKL